MSDFVLSSHLWLLMARSVEYLYGLSIVSNEQNFAHELYLILMVLPFSTADKSDTQNSFGDILVDLLLIAIYG